MKKRLTKMIDDNKTSISKRNFNFNINDNIYYDNASIPINTNYINNRNKNNSKTIINKPGTNEQPKIKIRYNNLNKNFKSISEPFKIGSWNVGTMVNKQWLVIDTVRNLDLNICCLQETRYKNAGIKHFDGYSLLYQGGNKGQSGVAIMMKETHRQNLITVTRHSDRIIQARMIYNKLILNIISVYAPQKGLPDKCKLDFWDQLYQICSNIPETDCIMIGGDLNAHVGSSEGFSGIHGGYNFDNRDKEGENVLEFCAAQRLQLANTLFTKSKNKLITYTSGNNNTTIDYILTSQHIRKYLVNTTTYNSETQHKVLTSIFKFNSRPFNHRTKPKLNIHKFKKPDIMNNFKKSLNLNIDNLDVEDSWQSLRSNTIENVEKWCGRRKSKAQKKWWWDDAIKPLLKEKARLYKKWKKSKTENDKTDYYKYNKKVQKEINKLMNEKAKDTADKLEKEIQNNKIFKHMKLYNNNKKDIPTIKCIKDNNNNLQIQPELIKSIWQKYMEQNLNNPLTPIINSDRDPCCGPLNTFTIQEIEIALDQMKSNKASGPSELCFDIIKLIPNITMLLTNLFNKIIVEMKIPKDWEKSIIFPIFKNKGDILTCSSYRPLKLLEHGLKIFEMCLKNRIVQLISINPMQFAFSAGKSTIDPIFLLRQLQDKYRAKGRKLFHLFVDLEKAYDSVPRALIIESLRYNNVDEYTIKLIMLIYTNSISCVLTPVGNSEYFSINTGLHQGSVLSPLLFIAIIDYITKDMREGLPYEILYADDLIITAEDISILENKYLIWSKQLHKYGLKINTNKTKILITGDEHKTIKFPCPVCSTEVKLNSLCCTKCRNWVHKKCSNIKGKLINTNNFICTPCASSIPQPISNPRTINFNGDKLEVVTSFPYLGDYIASDGSLRDAISHRIRQGWAKFNQLKYILTNKYIKSNHKIKIYKMGIRPAMTYATETWALTATDLNRLTRAENHMLKICNNNFDNTIEEDEPIALFIQRNRLRYYGHIQRMNSENWVQKIQHLNIPGPNRKGRPKLTWSKQLTQDLSHFNIEHEQVFDRTLFRKLVHGNPRYPGT